jgi:hypothetical protein
MFIVFLCFNKCLCQSLSEHQTIQPVLVRVYMAHALVLVVFVSNYVVVLFSFVIVTNVLISPCIFLLLTFTQYLFFAKSEHEFL